MILICESAGEIHCIKEMSRDKKGRRFVMTRCGSEQNLADAPNVSIWESDITCPTCRNVDFV